MNKYLKIILGLIIILAGVYVYVAWTGALQALWTVVKGCIGLAVIMIGLLFLLLGFTE